VLMKNEVIILSNFGFNILAVSDVHCQSLRFPIDFAGHVYNIAAATVQRVIRKFLRRMWVFPVGMKCSPLIQCRSILQAVLHHECAGPFSFSRC